MCTGFPVCRPSREMENIILHEPVHAHGLIEVKGSFFFHKRADSKLSVGFSPSYGVLQLFNMDVPSLMSFTA